MSKKGWEFPETDRRRIDDEFDRLKQKIINDGKHLEEFVIKKKALPAFSLRLAKEKARNCKVSSERRDQDPWSVLHPSFPQAALEAVRVKAAQKVYSGTENKFGKRNDLELAKNILEF